MWRSSDGRQFGRNISRADWIVFAVVIVVAGTGWFLLRSRSGYGDEPWAHLPHILSFAEGRFELEPGVLPMIPGYHVVMAILSRLTGADSLANLRLLSLMVSLPSVFFAYLCVEHLKPGCGAVATLQYFLLPILFPFFFLLYTDALSLVPLCLGVLCYLKGRHNVAGLVLFVGMFVRQTTVVWLLMFFLMTFLEQRRPWITVSAVREHLSRCWSYAFGLAVFSGFVIVNKGLALPSQHAGSITISTGNLFFSLFVFFIVFLPMHLGRIPAILQLLRRRPVLLLVLGLAFLVYLATFRADHPSQRSDWFLRNWMLHRWFDPVGAQAVAFLPIAWAGLSLAVTRLMRPSMYLLYVFWILALLPVWLIEQRYYIPIFTLYLVFRESESPYLEWTTVAYFSVVNAVFGWFMLDHRIFL